MRGMTKPPCYNGEVDCEKRRLGCRAGCEKWEKWLAIHAEEKAAIEKAKRRTRDAAEHVTQTIAIN